MTGLGEVERLLRERRSVRQFAGTPVDLALVTRLLSAAAWAPSPSNRQAWGFTVVVSPALRQQIAAAVHERWQGILDQAAASAVGDELRDYARNFDWFGAAPVVIVVSTREPEAFLGHLLGARAMDVAGGRVAAAMATQNLMLAAHAAGLGTCCLTGPLAAEDELKRLLGLGKRQSLVCLVALGYAAGGVSASPRKPVNDVMRIME